MSEKEVDSGWHIADFHVHTPASTDYKGAKTKEEYRKIISPIKSSYKREVEKSKSAELIDKNPPDAPEIKILAITDHNTIDGFKTIMEIRRETSDLINKLRERDPNLEYIKTLLEEETELNKIHILMGLEIKPSPGIHLLLIFQENVNPTAVEEFLKDGLGEDYTALKGNPEPLLKWDINDVLEELNSRFGNKVAAIAPHVDSNSGIYEGLKLFGQLRMKVFKHPLLKGISFNNPEIREKIKNLLSQPEYKRSSQLAFIQSSDYHSIPGYDIGVLHTKIYLGDKKINFSTIFGAFSNESLVRCSCDFVQETYQKLIEGFSLQQFSSCTPGKLAFSDVDYRSLTDTICAYLNWDGGIIEISANITISEDKSPLIKEVQDSLNEILAARLKPELPTYDLNAIQISNSKFIVLFLFLPANKLFLSEGKIYILKEHHPCPADSNEIEYMVARNLNRRFGRSIENKLERLSHETRRVSKIQRSYPIAVRYENKYEDLMSEFLKMELMDIHESIEGLEELIEKYNNGFNPDNSNTEVSNSESLDPRYRDSYLRFGIPSYQVEKVSENNAIFRKEKGLVVVPGGGIMLSLGDKYFHCEQPTIILTSKKDIDLLMILAWMKSSFFVWYCSTILGDIDIFRLLIAGQMRKMPFPGKNYFDYGNIMTFVHNILLEEKRYLKESVKLSKEEDKDALNKITLDHNKKVDAYCRGIDIEILKYVGINLREAKDIYKTLDFLNVYDYGVKDNIKELDQIK